MRFDSRGVRRCSPTQHAEPFWDPFKRLSQKHWGSFAWGKPAKIRKWRLTPPNARVVEWSLPGAAGSLHLQGVINLELSTWLDSLSYLPNGKTLRSSWGRASSFMYILELGMFQWTPAFTSCKENKRNRNENEFQRIVTLLITEFSQFDSAGWELLLTKNWAIHTN